LKKNKLGVGARGARPWDVLSYFKIGMSASCFALVSDDLKDFDIRIIH
jgi:hypothetical protein